MRTCIIALIAAVSLLSGPRESTPPPAPDFSWQDKCPAPARSLLKLSQSKWTEAAAAPDTPESLKPGIKSAPFDERYLSEFINRGNMANASYYLLDVAVRKQQILDESKTAFEKALASCKAKPAAASGSFTDAYLCLRSNLKLAIGLARADISRQMMGPDDSSYCFQAMESAIDALRDAAKDADKVPGGAKRAESIRKLRSTLFDVWEQAERSKDTSIIGAINLRRAYSEAFAHIVPAK